MKTLRATTGYWVSGSVREVEYAPKQGPARIGTPQRWQPKVSRSLRAWVLERDRGRCRVCGEPGRQVRHLISWRQGGQTIASNLACICASCNGKTALRTLDSSGKVV